MSNSHSSDLRGLQGPHNSMFRFTYRVGQQTRTHDCFAQVVGEALYSTHTWIQHKEETAPADYEILKAERLLRHKQKADDIIFSIVGSVVIDDWPRGNPEVPKVNRARKKDDNYADALPFMQDEVPVMTHFDVLRQREKESLLPTEMLVKMNGGKL